MLQFKKLGAAALFFCLLAGAENAEAGRRGPYPVTQCGPGLAYLCPIRGFFDAPPFHYNLAIYPGCIKWVKVETPQGLRRRPVLICG